MNAGLSFGSDRVGLSAGARVGLLACDLALAGNATVLLGDAGFAPIWTRDETRFVGWAEMWDMDIGVLVWPAGTFTAIQCCEHVRRRANCAQLPLIVVSDLADSSSRIRSLEAGANRHVCLPGENAQFTGHLNELLLSLKAQEGWQRYGEFALNEERRKISWSGKTIHLTTGQFEMLRLFVINQGRLLSHQSLGMAANGGRSAGTARKTALLMVGVRRALRAVRESDPIKSVAGLGYVLEP